MWGQYTTKRLAEHGRLFFEGAAEKASLRLGLTFVFVRHSGVGADQGGRVRRNPFLPLSLALHPDILAPGRGGYGHRHIYPPHPFRTRVRRSLPRVGIKCKNESKNHKMDSGFRRNDGGFPASRGFLNNPLKGGVIFHYSVVVGLPLNYRTLLNPP